jgi:hypothetical protein
VCAEGIGDPHRARVVARDNDEFASGRGELDEGGVERLVRAVEVEVVGVDVGDERDGLVVEQERPVGFVGFDDEQLARAPSSSREVMIMPVDVVLPWAPATAMRRCPLMSQARACERCSTGMPRSTARRYSGLSGQRAPVKTSASASPRLDASCPMVTVAPRSRSASVLWFSLRSDPVTVCPAARKRRAMPLMPDPPMPTKWTVPSAPGRA